MKTRIIIIFFCLVSSLKCEERFEWNQILEPKEIGQNPGEIYLMGYWENSGKDTSVVIVRFEKVISEQDLRNKLGGLNLREVK